MRSRAVVILTLCAIAPAAAQPPDRVAIAPVNEALTFARIATSSGPRLLAVQSYENGEISGVLLDNDDGQPARDAIALFADHGYAGLRDRIAAADKPVQLRVEALASPVDLHAQHIAVGTNYPAHADESQVEDGPFLFPKHVVPTGPRATVSAGDRLLDYEVELCWVTLQDQGPDDTAAHWGLLLCNDYTDRAALLRHLDPDDVVSGKGFTTGKSFDGALPVGDLLVIPRDPRAFAAGIELRLYRNGELRQLSPVSRAIWNIDAILSESWQRHETTWAYGDAHVGLFEQRGILPARTLILSGTPDGTVFRGITLAQKLRGALRWIASGFDGALPRAVIETYIADARRSGNYLQPGETVLIRSDTLGSIENRIVP
jgi:2,4-didehydro-3-deoxy-L-rhamnonate hydrolase